MTRPSTERAKAGRATPARQPKPTKREPLALIEKHLELSKKLKIPDAENCKVNLELSLSQANWRRVAAVLREAGSK